MLREKILRKIYITTFIVFILFVLSSFSINKNISNIKVEYQNKLSNIYLLNDDNRLLEVELIIDDDVLKSIPIIINNLKSNNKNYHGLKGIIPESTKINSMKIDNGILYIDFNKELLNVNKDLEEKVIESLVYSLLNLKEIKGLRISIDNKPLKVLPNSNIIVDDILTKNFGINKEYCLNSMQDVKKVTLYYYEENNSNNYYVPITKYINSSDDKVKIIIDNLKNNYLGETNLMSYINDKIKIKNYEYQNNIVTLTFANINELVPSNIKEEVIYTLANSLFDSADITKVIFMENDNIIDIKIK